MAELNYNMADIFGAAFGAGNIPLKYQIDQEEKESPAFDYSGLDIISQDKVVGQSWLGTPINFKFGLKGGSYQYYEGGQLKQKQVQDFQMPLSTMVDFTRAKRAKSIPYTAGYGEDIHMFGFNAWSIRIRGVCLYDPDHPQESDPREQRNIIAGFENLADGIDLLEDDNVFTDLGIYKIFIDQPRFGQIEGKPNWYPFELQCKSVEPEELR
jgi:hypothetical protein